MSGWDKYKWVEWLAKRDLYLGIFSLAINLNHIKYLGNKKQKINYSIT